MTAKTLIKWKLREVMAREKCKNCELAEALGMNPSSVSRLKRMDTMPQLTHDRLNAICNKLRCRVADLLEFYPDHDAA